MTGEPRVRVVVVNHNGGDLTLECVRALLATDWPAHALEIVLVDNASDDGVAARVRESSPQVRVVPSRENVGFGRANNLALSDLDRIDSVALVNNDVIVAPGWLRPLVAALDEDDRVGAACPKVVFADEYHAVHLDVTPPGTRRHGTVRLDGADIDGRDVSTRLRHREGFAAAGRDGSRWILGGHATVLVPSQSGTSDAVPRLRLRACGTAQVRLEVDGAELGYALGPDTTSCVIPTERRAQRLVNSTGVVIDADGRPHDRGYLEPDEGQYDDGCAVDAWSGSTVLLRSEFLRDVGLFDPRLFMYYEDIELSARGARRGWRYRYVPDSRVDHVHSASAVVGSTFAEFHNERSRLLVLALSDSRRDIARELWRTVLITLSYAMHDLRASFGAACAPERHHAAIRARAFLSFLAAMPATLRRRRRLR